MTKTVGLTGGIGSGKSTVASMFSELGVPVYIADEEAKKLMVGRPGIQKKIKALLGAESYRDGQLDRDFIARKVFKDQLLLKKLNGIVHPAVAEHFLQWKNHQKTSYVIKEAAILFENGGYKDCDFTILVTAPEETRIQRVLKRDKTTRSKIKQRMQHQWKDAEKEKLADFSIKNIDLEKTKLKVKEIHNKIVLL